MRVNGDVTDGNIDMQEEKKDKLAILREKQDTYFDARRILLISIGLALVCCVLIGVCTWLVTGLQIRGLNTTLNSKYSEFIGKDIYSNVDVSTALVYGYNTEDKVAYTDLGDIPCSKDPGKAVIVGNSVDGSPVALFDLNDPLINYITSELNREDLDENSIVLEDDADKTEYLEYHEVASKLNDATVTRNCGTEIMKTACYLALAFGIIYLTWSLLNYLNTGRKKANKPENTEEIKDCAKD